MAEQIEFSLFDYFADTSAGVSEMVSVMTEKPEAEAAGAGRKNYAYDVGSELWGARKHLAALTKFTPEWYEALEKDPTQAYDAICKDALLEGFRPVLLREQGFASESAFAIKLIWDRVSKRPADDAKQREYFVQAIAKLKLVFVDAYNEDLFMQAFQRLKEEVWNAYHSQYERRVKEKPFLIDFAFWLSLGDRFMSIFIGFGKGKVPAYHKIFSRAFNSEEGRDWNWTDNKARSDSKRDNALRWERKVPEEVVRLSQEPSGVEKPEDLIQQYGYRGIQFGNWVEDAAGRYHVLCSGNAHADLAAILKLPRAALSFYGALGLAFGARGTGRASAHFEAMPRNNINLTKFNGGGALCHEWAHALDFNLNSFSHDFVNGKAEALSGSKKPGPRLPDPVQRAFKVLMKRIKEGNGLLQYEVPEELPTVSRNWVSAVPQRLERYDYDVTKALASLNGSYRIKPKQLVEIGFFYCHLAKEAGKEVPVEFFVPSDFSSFFLDAKARGDYWKRDHELFARAFEAWIEDELFDRGMTNSYLVCGTRFGGPYPQGEERTAINNAFRDWWSVLYESGILHNEELWKKC
ncbi:LPD1 domain-containing protein [Paenibacillus gansuensis]|uniref:LPD1 domain-containing protein n=1 Tax=Paenibacillus gansuensis TaxID=306542 RepID=A0ABW5PIP6_9BACL